MKTSNAVSEQDGEIRDCCTTRFGGLKMASLREYLQTCPSHISWRRNPSTPSTKTIPPENAAPDIQNHPRRLSQ